MIMWISQRANRVSEKSARQKIMDMLGGILGKRPGKPEEVQS
jgi:hypothetical protein